MPHEKNKNANNIMSKNCHGIFSPVFLLLLHHYYHSPYLYYHYPYGPRVASNPTPPDFEVENPPKSQSAPPGLFSLLKFLKGFSVLPPPPDWGF